MIYPNDEKEQCKRLKEEYGVNPERMEDVVLLTPTSQLETRKEEYPNIEVHSIAFDSSELNVKDWMFLMGAIGNDSTYIREIKQIMKSCGTDISLQNIRHGVEGDTHLSQSQQALAEQRLNFASEYISDGSKLREYLRPD